MISRNQQQQVLSESQLTALFNLIQEAELNCNAEKNNSIDWLQPVESFHTIDLKQFQENLQRIYSKIASIMQIPNDSNDPNEQHYHNKINICFPSYLYWDTEMLRVFKFVAEQNSPHILPADSTITLHKPWFQITNWTEANAVLQSLPPINSENIIVANPFKSVNDMKKFHDIKLQWTVFNSESELHRIAQCWPDAKLLISVISDTCWRKAAALLDNHKQPALYLQKLAIKESMVARLIRLADQLNLRVSGAVCFNSIHSLPGQPLCNWLELCQFVERVHLLLLSLLPTAAPPELICLATDVSLPCHTAGTIIDCNQVQTGNQLLQALLRRHSELKICVQPTSEMLLLVECICARILSKRSQPIETEAPIELDEIEKYFDELVASNSCISQSASTSKSAADDLLQNAPTSARSFHSSYIVANSKYTSFNFHPTAATFNNNTPVPDAINEPCGSADRRQQFYPDYLLRTKSAKLEKLWFASSYSPIHTLNSISSSSSSSKWTDNECDRSQTATVATTGGDSTCSTSTIFGNTCCSSDVIVSRMTGDIEAQPGDWLIWTSHSVDPFSTALQSLFNGVPRPTRVYLDSTRRLTPEDAQLKLKTPSQHSE